MRLKVTLMATTNVLSDKAIRAAMKSAGKSREAQRLSDGDGLRIDVQPSGAGWWRLRYRFGGKEGMLSLGTYPEVPLALARQRRDEARAQVAAGIDPSAARKAAKRQRSRDAAVKVLVEAGKAVPGSFEFIAREWLETVHREKVSAGHADRTLIRFEKDVFPYVGARHLAELEAPELLTMLRRIESRGAIETAHRAKDACGQVFRYGIAAGYCNRNPAADLRDALKPVSVRHHAAIVDPKHGAELLRDMVKYQGHPVTRAALALSALLMLRPGELRQLEWAWIDFDSATLTIPGERMKRSKSDKANGVPHIVPLADQALTILRDELLPLTGGEGRRYVFRSLLSADRPMSENTVRNALRRMGYGNDDMTAHGFRAMARTMIAERLSVAPEVIEAQLAHQVGDALGRAYNRTQYLEQRRDMMQRWGDYLDRLREGAHVVSLSPRVA
jgi:integrase